MREPDTKPAALEFRRRHFLCPACDSAWSARAFIDTPRSSLKCPVCYRRWLNERDLVHPDRLLDRWKEPL